MKTTTLEEFREELLRTGGYDTAEGHCPKTRAKGGALTTLAYSWGVAYVFPMCALYEPLGKLTTDLWAHLCFKTVQRAERLGIRVHLEGWKNREAYKGPVVYLCNHMSTTETIFLPPILLTYGPFSVVAKESLSHLPLLGRAAAHMGMVGIGRKSPREDLVKLLTVGEERIRQGGSFLIFPQGTRQEVFSRKVFSSIGAKLAERAGCPIVPLVVDTRCQLTRKEGWLKNIFKDFGPVDTSKDIRCCCGPVIASAKARVMQEQAFDWMATQLEAWGLPTER